MSAPDEQSDEKKPKRPMSAYNYYFREQRKHAVLEVQSKVNVDEKSAANDTISSSRRAEKAALFSQVGKRVGEKWKNLPQSEKETYEKMAEEDMKRYTAELMSYQIKQARKRIGYLKNEGKKTYMKESLFRDKTIPGSDSQNESKEPMTLDNQQQQQREYYMDIAAPVSGNIKVDDKYCDRTYSHSVQGQAQNALSTVARVHAETSQFGNGNGFESKPSSTPNTLKRPREESTNYLAQAPAMTYSNGSAREPITAAGLSPMFQLPQAPQSSEQNGNVNSNTIFESLQSMMQSLQQNLTHSIQNPFESLQQTNTQSIEPILQNLVQSLQQNNTQLMQSLLQSLQQNSTQSIQTLLQSFQPNITQSIDYQQQGPSADLFSRSNSAAVVSKPSSPPPQEEVTSGANQHLQTLITMMQQQHHIEAENNRLRSQLCEDKVDKNLTYSHQRQLSEDRLSCFNPEDLASGTHPSNHAASYSFRTGSTGVPPATPAATDVGVLDSARLASFFLPTQPRQFQLPPPPHLQTSSSSQLPFFSSNSPSSQSTTADATAALLSLQAAVGRGNAEALQSTAASSTAGMEQAFASIINALQNSSKP